MKKVLLSLTLVSSFLLFGQAQSVLTENFDLLTNGNLGTDATGATAGQNGWYTQGGTNTDYQIVNVDVAHGKSLQITSGNSYAASSNPNNRFSWKNFSGTASATNDIVRVAGQIYTGPATGAGRMQIVAYDPTIGVIGGLFYDYTAKTIGGLSRVQVVANPTQVGTLSLGLGTETFAANTWVSILYSYNKTTGQHTFAYSDGTNGGNYSFSGSPTYAVVTGLVAGEVDVNNITLTGNTVANVAAVDNLEAEFTNASTLSVDETKDVIVNNDLIAIYPNPATDVLNIKSEGKVISAAVYDISGKRINARLKDNQVDVRALQSGNYIITIETENGVTSEKFIKK